MTICVMLLALAWRRISSATSLPGSVIASPPNCSASLNVAASAQAKSSNGLVQQSVRSDKNAIGFVSFDFVQGTNAVGYQGVPCSLRNAKSGQYKGVRNFWMVTRGAPTGAAKQWIKWIQTNAAAKRIVGTDWIPIR